MRSLDSIFDLARDGRKTMNPYCTLAKKSIDYYFKTGKIMEEPKDLPSEMKDKKAGVFVTLKHGKELRGCIGTFLPTQKSVAKEIIENAVAAATRDNRFLPITKEELPELSYEVSILSPPKPVKDTKKLDPKKYGIIIKCEDGRTGLLLPDLEGVDTVEKQILIACQKGAINPLTDKISIFCFTVKKYSS